MRGPKPVLAPDAFHCPISAIEVEGLLPTEDRAPLSKLEKLSHLYSLTGIGLPQCIENILLKARADFEAVCPSGFAGSCRDLIRSPR